MKLNDICKSLLACSVGVGALAAMPAHAEQTTITLARFFGACEADYGKVNDVTKAKGECGIITSLVNQFNATNKDGIVVKPEIAEWGPYYDQLTSRIVAHNVPTIAVMHQSVLGDFVSRKLVEPLDDGFKSVGINTADFTPQARHGVILGGKTYALPFDTWSWLWHLNTNILKKAGLTNADGSPILPKSPDELLAQAEKVKQATGKPYFAWTTANETAAPTRTFFTLVYQQNAQVFSADGRKISVHTAAATNALTLMNKLWTGGYIKKGLDYGATQQAFLNGDVAVDVVGNWTIDDFYTAAQKPDSALHDGYDVVPFANLYSKQAVFADGHSWVMIKGGAKSDKEKKAALTFMKFLWDHDFDWSRTGHLPANNTVVQSAQYKAMPFRNNIIDITRYGVSTPSNVPRQRAIEAIVGEEISSMMLSGKAIPAVEDAIETRVNTLLAGVK
ncbi:extracellular solute-binding protein [Silvimonas amylolytica]|uniref:Sugar ABC transporter substrate-binding protein n=1 Tax=Silvimonas amylolytica TaxID=449663 RepID=A0ABQ2PNS5_9NEIS|nr:extracellular solute-binding protein [Silvimonas amylolytica]GGP26871.1 sugar ABC transporter substrate-binding protein [Silvimonas amylolytica]